ncbi:MAG: sensor histidine kinase, partial [Trichloromonadaceae bacterium]
RIVLVNDQAERLFGYQADELLGQLHRRLLPERFLQRHDEHQTNFLAQPSTLPMGSELELYGLRKDGREFPLEISLSPLPTAQGLEVICIVRDITLRKRTEQELHNHRVRLEELVAERTRELEEKSAALEKATRLKSEFLANMSHELRTPMNSIIGFTERVILKSGETLPPRQLTNLHTVRRNAHQLLELINSLLDISKIEAGRMEVLPEEFELQSLLREVVELTEPLVFDKGLSMQLSAPEQPIVMLTDRAKLRQILVNLVGNGVKFTEQGGITLRVLPELSGLEPQPSSDYVIIEVSDTGPGISPENQTQIFEPFVQGDGSDARRSSGTGLGLAIVKNFTAMLQGQVKLSSTQGLGTTLTLTLPRVWDAGRSTAGLLAAEPLDIHMSDQSG